MGLEELCSEGKHHHLLHALRHEDPSPSALNEAAHAAAFHGHAHCLALVLAAGADPHSLNSNGHSMLIEAMHSGNIDAVLVLIQAPCDVNFSPTPEAVHPLHYALVADNAEELVNMLLSAGAQVDVRIADGDTPLIVASAMGLPTIVKMLLEFNADVNAVGFEGCTALHRAVQQWDQEIALDLLGNGADPGIQNDLGDSPFLTACATGNIEVLQLIIDKELMATPDVKNKSKQNALHCAAQSGNAKIAEVLLKLGVDPQSSDKDSNTPIMIAAQMKQEKFALKLLALGNLDVNVKGEKGRTVLHWASVNGLKALVSSVLAQKDVDASIQDNTGDTPLILAAKNKQYAVIELLMARNMGLQAQDRQGFTLLHWLIFHGQKELVEKLLENNDVQLDISDIEGVTPLVLAASLQHWSELKMLLEKGSRADLSGKNGRTALHWVSQAGQGDLIKQMITKGCDPNAQDAEKKTSLVKAVMNGQEEAVTCLLEAGADVNIHDAEGRTALHYAARGKHASIVAKLLEVEGVEVNGADDGESALLAAAERGHEDIVMMLLDRSDPNMTGANGKTALWCCCAHGLEGCVARLLYKGAEVNQQHSPLIQAAMIGHSRIVKKLLDNGARVHETDSLQRTALMWAAQKGYLEIVKQLVEIGKADVLASDKTSDTALTIATWHGNESVVEYLAPLSKLSDCETEEGMDALHLAIAKDNPSMVSILLQAGASINTLDKRDHTALLAASVHTSGSAILTLLFESKQAFDVNISGSMGRTMLHWCVGDPTSVELVLHHEPSLNVVDINGASPILLAIAHSQPNSARMLIEAGCDIRMVHQDGRSPIHHAVLYGDSQTTRLLLDMGIDVNTPATDGRTPILLASIEGHADIVDILIEHGCHINHVYFSAITPLSVASDRKHYKVIQRLLDAGADPNLIGPEKFPPLLTCVFNRFFDGAVLLIQGGADYEGETVAPNTHPLQVAAIKGFVDITMLLLAVCCDMAAMRNVYRELVLLTEDEVILSAIRDMSRRPKKLKILCRKEVRRHLTLPKKSAIAQLQVPTFLKTFLQMDSR